LINAESIQTLVAVNELKSEQTEIEPAGYFTRLLTNSVPSPCSACAEGKIGIGARSASPGAWRKIEYCQGRHLHYLCGAIDAVGGGVSYSNWP